MFLSNLWGKFALGGMGFCFGVLSAAGVFTVLLTVGLIPRFAGETHTNMKVFLYEEWVIIGAILGCILTVWEPYCQIGMWMQNHFGQQVTKWIGNSVLWMEGIFSGMFVGSLAITIAEMLNSIPIFMRRVKFRMSLVPVVWSIALGKMIGSFFYFAWNIGKK